MVLLKGLNCKRLKIPNTSYGFENEKVRKSKGINETANEIKKIDRRCHLFLSIEFYDT